MVFGTAAPVTERHDPMSPGCAQLEGEPGDGPGRLGSTVRDTLTLTRSTSWPLAVSGSHHTDPLRSDRHEDRQQRAQHPAGRRSGGPALAVLPQFSPTPHLTTSELLTADRTRSWRDRCLSGRALLQVGSRAVGSLCRGKPAAASPTEPVDARAIRAAACTRTPFCTVSYLPHCITRRSSDRRDRGTGHRAMCRQA